MIFRVIRVYTAADRPNFIHESLSDSSQFLAAYEQFRWE